MRSDTVSGKMGKQTFTTEVIQLIHAIPAGKVSTYGRVAAMAGNPRAARQVVRVLHTFSEKEGLPWWRVVNRDGRVALKTEWGRDEQEELLEQEGIEFDAAGYIDLAHFLWQTE